METPEALAPVASVQDCRLVKLHHSVEIKALVEVRALVEFLASQLVLWDPLLVLVLHLEMD